MKEQQEYWREFAHGFRVMMLNSRNKDGNHGNIAHLKRITTCEQEFENALSDLRKAKKELESKGVCARIYVTLNRRSPEAAIREFKTRQLDSDYFDSDSKYSFYLDIKNRFISCLMKQSCRLDHFFLIDVDEEGSLPKFEEELATNGAIIVSSYPTKNGTHLITKPFNYTKLSFANSVNKDALMLLDF